MVLTVSQIAEDKNRSGWYEILPTPLKPRVLKEDIKADWVIVGAGFAGLSAAHRIHQQAPSDKVVVLDAQRIGWGASGRNSGFMIDLPHNVQSDDYSSEQGRDQFEVGSNRFAIEYARSMIEEFGLQVCKSEMGRINAAADEVGMKALKSYSSHIDALGEAYTRLDADELKKITGIDYYQGGIHTPGCLLIQPAAYIRGIAHGLQGDVDIFENSAVVRIETGSSNKVKTAHGSVEATNVILTVNGHLKSFGRYQKQLMHLSLYGSMTRELSKREQEALGGQPEWAITPSHPMGSTIRRIKENRIVVRNSISYNPNLEVKESQMQQAKTRHNLSFRTRFPMLNGVDMEYSWSGYLCLSLNSVSVFGEIENGVYSACCQNGLGATKGTLNGILLVDHIMGKTNSMIEQALNEEKPKKLYAEPFMTLGANARLWWGQRSAGREV